MCLVLVAYRASIQGDQMLTRSHLFPRKGEEIKKGNNNYFLLLHDQKKQKSPTGRK
jgi:hypothetical protein